MNNNMCNMFFGNPINFINKAVNNSELMKNPIAKNTIEMMRNGDTKGTEETARNLLKERGINPDEALRNVKAMFGVK